RILPSRYLPRSEFRYRGSHLPGFEPSLQSTSLSLARFRRGRSALPTSRPARTALPGRCPVHRRSPSTPDSCRVLSIDPDPVFAPVADLDADLGSFVYDPSLSQGHLSTAVFMDFHEITHPRPPPRTLPSSDHSAGTGGGRRR